MNSNQKGKKGERELAAILKSYGYEDSRRGQQYCGSNGDADVVGLPGIHIECKRVSRCSRYYTADWLCNGYCRTAGSSSICICRHSEDRSLRGREESSSFLMCDIAQKGDKTI